MKIAVIGSSGKSGLKFIDNAINQSFQIRAGINRDNKLKENANLEIVKCNALDLDQVINLLTGCQAVVSLIGHKRNSPADLQSKSIENVIEAMKKNGIKRLVSLTGTGVRVKGDKITIIDRILNFTIKLIDPKRIKDGIKHAEIINKSDLDWTIIRVLKLHDLYTGKFKLSQNGPTKILASRIEVAQAILQTLNDESYLKKLPILSKI